MHFHNSKRCEYNLRLWGDSFVFHDYEKSTLCLKVTEVKHTHYKPSVALQHFHCMQMHRPHIAKWVLKQSRDFYQTVWVLVGTLEGRGKLKQTCLE